MKKRFFATTAIAVALAFAIPAPVQALELGVGGKTSAGGSFGGIVGGVTQSTESITTSVHGSTDTDINGVTTTETTTQATSTTDLGVGSAVQKKKKLVRHRTREARPAISSQTQETVKSTTVIESGVNADANIGTNADINTHERSLLGGQLRTDGNLRVNN